MSFKNLHRRCRGLTPKTKGILSLSMITTIYVCMLAHTHAHTVNDKCMHTHTNQYNSSKSFEPFFFSPTKHHKKKPFYGHKSYQDLVSLGTTFTYSKLVVRVRVVVSSSIPNGVFCCLALPMGLILGPSICGSGLYTKNGYSHTYLWRSSTNVCVEHTMNTRALILFWVQDDRWAWHSGYNRHEDRWSVLTRY